MVAHGCRDRCNIGLPERVDKLSPKATTSFSLLRRLPRGIDEDGFDPRRYISTLDSTIDPSSATDGRPRIRKACRFGGAWNNRLNSRVNCETLS